MTKKVYLMYTNNMAKKVYFMYTSVMTNTSIHKKLKSIRSGVGLNHLPFG